MTSSPGPTPSSRRAISRHAVAEFRHTAPAQPHAEATFPSSSLALAPVVIHPLRMASATAEISASVMSGGANGMFLIIHSFRQVYLRPEGEGSESENLLSICNLI